MTGCASTASPTRVALATPGAPATELVLLSLGDGSRVASASVGTDGVGVALSTDGRTAYIADNDPGNVIAVSIPDMAQEWTSHVGGAPFAVLPYGGHLYVSLFDGAAVDELDPATGRVLASHKVKAGPGALAVDPQGRVMVAGTRGEVDFLDGTSIPGGNGFAAASIDGEIWTEDYERAELVRTRDGHRVGLPDPVYPFWLAPGGAGTLLVSAEGPREDLDPGAVYAYDTGQDRFTTLARPKDPDQVLQSGNTTFIAAHGERDVLAIRAGRTLTWATGTAAVAVAADPALDLLLVLANSHE